MSRRSIDGFTEYQKCPDVTSAQTRTPMKSRLTSAIRKSRLTEQSLYIPQEKSRGVMSVPIEPERIRVISVVSGAVLLNESDIYEEYLAIQ